MIIKLDKKEYCNYAESLLNSDKAHIYEECNNFENFYEIYEDWKEALLEDGPDSEAFYEDEEAAEAVIALAFENPNAEITPEMKVFLVYIYECAIVAGDAKAMESYGNIFYSGTLGVQDFNMAKKLYEMAVAHGLDESLLNLGYIYYYGRCGEQDYQKAYECFSKYALISDDTQSYYKLADLYFHGRYVQEDKIYAYRLLCKALAIETDKPEDETDARSLSGIFKRLADCMYYGFGTEIDYDGALMAYHNAEHSYYELLKMGDNMVRNLYDECIEMQGKCREKLQKSLLSC
ncbi:MAG: hypothetical protein MJZ32_11925 [Bacteroidaceae bacterium]|nr:hypothetical protein [Bacteroidaceae bacterium]